MPTAKDINSQKSEKEKALEAALMQIDKKFGKGSVMTLGDDNARLDIDAISTGSISLDLACGIGGKNIFHEQILLNIQDLLTS